MKEKGKEKDESKRKEEAPPISADPKLDKIVLHNLPGTPTRKIIMKIIDRKKEDPEDGQG